MSHVLLFAAQAEVKAGPRPTDRSNSSSIERKGTRLVSGSRDKTVRLWDTTTLDCLGVFVRAIPCVCPVWGYVS
jgi:WD40 repeat protein